MANTILNFHFDYLNPSLIKIIVTFKKKDQKYDGWDSSKIYKVWDKNRPVQTFVP